MEEQPWNLPTIKFGQLPGGTWDNMRNSQWAGLNLDDFVISSWEGYKKNDMKNGYTPSANGSDQTTDLMFESCVQTPGFAALPLCMLSEVKANLAKHDYDSRYPGFPCNQ